MNSESRAHLKVGEFYYTKSVRDSNSGVLYLVAQTDSFKPVVLILEGPYNFRMFNEIAYVHLPEEKQDKMEVYFLLHRTGRPVPFLTHEFYRQTKGGEQLTVAHVTVISIETNPVKTIEHLKELLDTEFCLPPRQRDRILSLFRITHENLFQAVPPTLPPL